MTRPVAMVALIAALVALMGGVRLLQAGKWVGAEVGRKLVHAGMGLIALSLPGIFSETWPVWVLAVIAMLLLGAVRQVPAMTRRFGQVLGGIDRASWGEMFFPLGVAIAFTLARRQPAAFCGGVSVLALGDTAGALVGTRWGRRRYVILGHTKSWEGSSAVWVVSTMCIALASATLGAVMTPAGFVRAVAEGAVAALAEALLPYGLDNLILPVLVAVLMMH